MSKQPNIPCLIAAIALCLAPQLPAEEPVGVLREQVNELTTDLDRPIDDFNRRYEEQLIALKEQAQKDGNLDLALAAAKEVTSYKTVGSEPSADPKLKRLQEIYARETARLQKERSEKRIALLKGYRQRLETATETLTKAGDLDGALTYRSEAVAVGKEIDGLAAAVAAATPPPVSPRKPETAPEPEEEKEPEFVAGVYTMGEGFGPTITFHDSGRYDAGFFGSGRWKSKGPGKMVLNSSDDFKYIAERDVWTGTINFGGPKEVVLKLAGAKSSDKESDTEEASPRGRFQDRDGDKSARFSPRGRRDRE